MHQEKGLDNELEQKTEHHSSYPNKESSPDKELAEKFKKMMPSIFAQCHPISNLEDLSSVLSEPPNWVNRVERLVPRSQFVVQNTLSDCHSEVNHFLPRKRLDSRTLPKTLVCHDYKGGYQADKYLHFAHEEILGNGYTFYNWSQIDIFVYFSHHFITIPPLCWINAGHKSGVKVLGTLITEFDPGSVICDQQIFRDMYSMKNFAKSLATLTEIFKFDGWLLNIENKVDNIEVLKEFVPYLTKLIHEYNPENLVIWYDSVTVDGLLKWQNELNHENKWFFDSCDGIFLNYTWTEKHLINTIEVAKHRHSDVFVGIDVFGRNMFGGGKFNTFKAAEMVTRYNLSMAIFAPGWTHETLERTDLFYERFLNRDLAFWCSLWPYLYTHPVNDFFETNFFIGLDKNCYNIFSQQMQLSKFMHPHKMEDIPDCPSIPTLNNKCGCIHGMVIGSRNGCVITKESLRQELVYVHHLFVCDLEIRGSILVYFLTKNLTETTPSRLSVTMLLSGSNQALRKVKLLADPKEKPTNSATLLEVNPCRNEVYENIRDVYSKYIEEQKWFLSVYKFYTNIADILEIGATLEQGNSVLLGAFGIKNEDQILP